jgi:hypothetical protein
MHEIALALVQGALSADTRAALPLAVRFVRESLMRQDPAATRAAARRSPSAGRARSSASRRRRCSSPATRTRGPAAGGARHGR